MHRGILCLVNPGLRASPSCQEPKLVPLAQRVIASADSGRSQVSQPSVLDHIRVVPVF
jgi:hypothetical protein